LLLTLMLLLGSAALGACRAAAPDAPPAAAPAAPQDGAVTAPQAPSGAAVAPSAAAQAAITQIDAWVTAGELDQALTLAREWSQREPQVAELHFAEGLVTRSKLSLEAAEPVFERALALRPRQGAWMVQIAAGYVEAGDEAGAERYLRRALEVDPYDGAAASMLGRILVGREDLEAALAVLAPAEGSGEPEVFAQMGLAHRGLEQLEEAERYLRRAADLDPRNLEVLLALGQLLQRTGRAEEGAVFLEQLETYSAQADALDFVESSSAVEGASATNYLMVGEMRRKQGDLDGATEAYRQAAARDPQNPTPLIGLATVALSRRDHAALLQHAQAAVALDASHAQAQLLLGLGQIRAGQSELAEATLALSRELSPWQAIQWDMSAQAYVDVGALDAAAQAYAQAYALDPGNDPLAQRLGLVHLLRGAPDEAVAVLTPAVERAPGSGDLALVLALAMHRLDDPSADAMFVEAASRFTRAGTSAAAAAGRYRSYPAQSAALDRFEELAASAP
jgi:Flp pilus assembly protein TadD